MKVESEPLVCHSNVSPKLAPKSFECDNNAFDSLGMKLENQNNELSGHLKNNEDANQLLHKDNAGNGWIASNYDLSDRDDYEAVAAFVSPLTNSSKVDFFEEDTEFYMEKSVVECQLPELIVCYKENICNIVKDICIDEGVPSRDKLLYDSCVDEKAVCTVLTPEKDWNDEFTRGLEKIEMFPSDELEHSESFGDNDSPKQCDSKDLTRTPEAEYDMAYFIDNDIPDLSLKDLVAESSEPFIDDNNEVHPQSDQVSSETANLEVPVLITTAEECNSNTEEATLTPYATTAPAYDDSESSTVVNDSSYNSKVDNGTITFDFNSLASTASYGSEFHDNGELNSSAPTTSASVDCEENSSSNSLATADKCQVQHHYVSDSICIECEDLPKVEIGISDRLSVPGQVEHGIGESSFAYVGPLGSVMCNSGRIGYSGSISQRSESSSTRSFAFPILQSEWNSSPVRMVKADRKRLWKHRGWKQSLLCCRF